MKARKYVFLILFFSAFMPKTVFPAEIQPHISLHDAAAKLNAKLFWDPLSGVVILSKNGHNANLRVGDEIVLFDYREFALLDPPVRRDGNVFLTPAFVDYLENFFETLPPSIAYRVGAILIDPGHGGKDPGAVGKITKNGKASDIREKDIVLKVAQDVYSRLKAQYPDKKILLTRSDDTYLSLEERVEKANSVKLEPHEAILYISIHANSAFNPASAGFEVWYLTPDYRRTVIDKSSGNINDDILPILNFMMEEEFTTESMLIAKYISDGLELQIGDVSANRGLKEEAWFVVRNARMPSVLIELGFVSNSAEAARLADDRYLQKCAAGIYNGLSVFISHFENSRGFTAQ
ncbi:N-acetylmuramoyl-L-alanine amidase [Brucepastera parasyntrophica]|uniref:N-acetylmuramoyl-L-alanine amidase n=1 Tax=Brucepastera parasyntrophica TaxID=2880008 RepID=UPI00210B1D55|nr:N-acetylmuramoyl-L-alanine amidase [Brucepastera parasyntrophica]ULQ60132.1 N-acetylmuramoyl-L-alanine amidase [Brucepastera parasyntrophica]